MEMKNMIKSDGLLHERRRHGLLHEQRRLASRTTTTCFTNSVGLGSMGLGSDGFDGLGFDGLGLSELNSFEVDWLGVGVNGSPVGSMGSSHGENGLGVGFDGFDVDGLGVGFEWSRVSWVRWWCEGAWG